MHAKDLVIDEGSNWHAVEHVLELLPDADTVSSLALIVEAIDSVDLCTLVISSQQEKVFRVLDLVAEEKHNRFDRLFPAVDVVTEEQVVGFGRETTILKDSKQVIVLAVHIA